MMYSTSHAFPSTSLRHRGGLPPVLPTTSARACGRSLPVPLFAGGPVQECQACARISQGLGWATGAVLAVSQHSTFTLHFHTAQAGWKLLSEKALSPSTEWWERQCWVCEALDAAAAGNVTNY